MQNPPPPSPRPNNDRQHLKLLGTMHYVYAGLMTLFTVFYTGYFYFIWTMMNTMGEGGGGSSTEVPSGFGTMFLGIGAFTLISGIINAVCSAIAGRCLSRRAGYWFTFIMAIWECLSVPLGTVLGIFTIIVLLRPSVKVLYGLQDPVEPQP